MGMDRTPPLLLPSINMLRGKPLMRCPSLILKVVHIATVDAIAQHHLILLVLHLDLRLIIAKLLK